MNIPKTRMEDLLNFNREQTIVDCKFIQGHISLKEKEEILERFKLEHRIFPEDAYFFDDIGKFWRFLIDNHLPTDCITHEMLHARKAFLLGYAVTYGCRLALVDNYHIFFAPFTCTFAGDKRISREDMLAILSSPDDLSEKDKNMLEYLKE